MTTQRQPLPIAAQIAKFQRLAADRRAHYRRTADKQPARATAMAEKDQELADIERSLRFLEAWRDDIRRALPEWQRRDRALAQQSVDLAALEARDADVAQLAADARASGATVRLTHPREDA